MESLIFLEQIFSTVGLNNSQTISIYRRRPKGTFYRRQPPGGRLALDAWRCVGRRPVIGRTPPSKSVLTRGGGLGGGTSSSERGSRGQRPMVLFRLGFLQRKPRPPRQRPPEGGTLHRPSPPGGDPGPPAAAPPAHTPAGGVLPHFCRFVKHIGQ